MSCEKVQCLIHHPKLYYPIYALYPIGLCSRLANLKRRPGNGGRGLIEGVVQWKRVTKAIISLDFSKGGLSHTIFMQHVIKTLENAA